jgi:phosphatidylglycerol:prolipoprotein diacylglycerol transferase
VGRQEQVIVGPARRRRGVGTASGDRVRATADTRRATSASWTDNLQREILSASCWLDPGDRDRPYSTRILFTGRRAGATGKPRAGDRFSKEVTIDQVIGGSGPVSVTTKVSDINPGEWIVTARPVGKGSPPLIEPAPSPSQGGAERTKVLLWPWGYRAMSTAPRTQVRTALIPFAPVPGVIPAAYSVFVLLGMLVGLAVQTLVLARSRLPVGAALTVSLWAVLAGIVGAKAWYVVGHRGRRFNGWCIQGFVLSAAAVAAIGATARLSMPVGTYLDSMAPGLLVGMAIGRLGCFLAGCCCGRATRSRWGVWSSDQKVGAKRIPTQLLESSLSFAVAVSALILVLTRTPAMPGGIFVGALAAYTFGRQFVLPLRARPLYTRFGRPIAMGTAAVTMAAAIVWSVAS